MSWPSTWPNATESLEHAQDSAGVPLTDDVMTRVRTLSALLAAPPGDALWEDEALDRHPTWAEARRLAREALRLLDDDDGSTR